MFEERFDRIDRHFTQIDQRFNEVDQHFTQVDQRFNEVDQHFTQVDQRLDRLETGQKRLEDRIEVLDRHMHVLHEDVIGRIAALPEYIGPTRAEFAELKEMIGRRLDPLEATVRQHSLDIERLKNSRG